jgi:SlyX protein
VESRLEEIESKLSLTEDLLDELNKTVYRQQSQIDQLKNELAALRDQVRTDMPGESQEPREEIPPHY